MCQIQSAVFDKNGTTNFDCTGKLTDTVSVDMMVSFGANEIGLRVQAEATIFAPDGQYHSVLSPVETILLSTTYDFVVPVSGKNFWTTGDYRIDRVDVYVEYEGIPLCTKYI